MTTENFDKRPNYFAGQYLLEDDFELEQNYQIDRQRRHNRLLHVSGIADGLIVTPGSDDLTVKISAGTAIDKNGQQIVWYDSDDMAKTPVKLQDINNAITNGNYILLIEFDEKLTTLQQGTTDGYTRWYEKPNFKLVPEPDNQQLVPDNNQLITDNFIVLAKLNINNKTVTIDDSDKNIRQYSGLRLPSTDQINAPTLRSGGDNASNLAVLRGSLSVTGNLSVSSTGNSSFAGNVGIGTIDPKQQLVVNIGKASIGYNDAQQTAALAVNGNVGIGTTTPTAKLEISNGNLKVGGNISATNATLTGNVGIGTPTSGVTLEVKGSTNNNTAAGLNVTDSQSKSLLYVRNDGSVGIGLSNDNRADYLNPASSVGTNSSLVVASKTKNLVAVGQNFELAKTESVLTFVRDGFRGESWSNIVDFRIGRYEKSGHASRTQLDILLAHHDLEKGSPLPNPPVETKLEQIMTLRSNGNVGIGTTNPLQTLDVNGRIHLNNGVIQRGGQTAINSTSDLGFYSQVEGNYIRFVTQNAPLRFYTDGGIGTNTRMSIEANGNVGIGTTSPPQKLVVVGGLRIVDPNNSSNFLDIRFESGNNTIVFYNQHGKGVFLRADGELGKNNTTGSW